MTSKPRGVRSLLLAGLAATTLLLGAAGCPGEEPAPLPGCEGVQPGPAPLRRLTRVQYDNTIGALFGGLVTPGQSYPSLTVSKHFSNDITLNALDQAGAEALFIAAEEVAAGAGSVVMAQLDCDPAVQGAEACLDHFFDGFGVRLYRRPVSEVQRQPLRALFAAELAASSFAEALTAVMEAMLASPQFLYLDEQGDAAAAADGVLPLDDYQLASRLSYLLWNSMPDDELLGLAAAGQLQQPEILENQARRMLDDPRTRAMVQQFHHEWLQLGRLEQVPKSSSAFPGYDAGLQAALIEQTERYAAHMYFEADADLTTLLTSPTTFVNGPVADHYGLASPADPTSWEQASWPTDQRAGLLTQPAFLAAQAHAETSSPVLRGVFIRRALLCHPLANPPANIDLELPARQPGETVKQQLEKHRSDAACAGCHQFMDPLGFGFEHYDAIGGWRDMDGALPVDASGEITGVDAANGPYDGAIELISRLAQSDDVRRCVATQWLRFSRARSEQDADRCDIDQLKGAFEQADLNLQSLLIALTQTDGFRYRPAP